MGGASRGSVTIISDGFRLAAHLARPSRSARGDPPGLIVCHGFPVGAGTAATAGLTFPQLADRISTETGWTCLSFCFRGAGTSQGQFSMAGWIADLRAAVAYLRAKGIDRVWLAGFSTGGTLALHVAGEDPDIVGLACLATPSDLTSWSQDPAYLLGLARQVGVYTADEDPDLAVWAAEVRQLNPLDSARLIPPRPFLLVHGSADETVSIVDARALDDAAEGHCELHVIPQGGHRLRHDPRAIAMLLGWLDRQSH
jgi:alpha/beta superfamily hydrolase